MSCPYEYYKEEEKYFPRLYCRVNDSMCIYSKRCNKVEKFLPMEDLQPLCDTMIKEKQKKIPSDSYYVQTYRTNPKTNKIILYVVIGDKVEKINTNFTKFNQHYVYLTSNGNGYDVSLSPTIQNKVEEKKSTTRTTKKKKNG